jgi:hypothetical protein
MLKKVYLSILASVQRKPCPKSMESLPTANNTGMDAIVLVARQVDSHWREFGPEHGFGELMDRLYAVIAQQHHA